MFYVRDLEKAKVGEGGIPDRQKLTEARKDLDKVLAVRPCLWAHLDMAQVKAENADQSPLQHQGFRLPSPPRLPIHSQWESRKVKIISGKNVGDLAT